MGVAILSRQFDDDREDVMRRAQSDGCCCGVVAWCSSVDKQATLVQFSTLTHDSYSYCVVGVHPDNIDRVNKKQQEAWLESIEELTVSPSCVGVLCGLNLTREVATHFAQESLVRVSSRLARKVQLPLYLHVPGVESLRRALDLLKEEEWFDVGDDETPALVIHDAVVAFSSKPSAINRVLSDYKESPIYFSVSAFGCAAPPPENEAVIDCIRAIPKDRLLICSNGPWCTPQNLPEADLITLKNEPSNVPSIAVYMATFLQCSVAEIAFTTRTNALYVLGLGKEPGCHDTPPTSPRAQALPVDNGVISDVAVPTVPRPAVTNFSYGCHKCRSLLFKSSDVVTEPLDNGPSEFPESVTLVSKQEKRDKKKYDDSGDVIFMKFADQHQGAIALLHGSVECIQCGQKLGRYTDVLCRINVSRVDKIAESTLSMNLQELVALSLREQERVGEDDSDDSSEGGRKKKKGKKKVVKQNNRSNMGDFRNKAFGKTSATQDD
jgi:Tat protein secretion system quality control protein TatD with DNase activity